MFLSLPQEKIVKAVYLLQFAIDNHKVKINFVQQLTGVLNFFNRAIVPGRAFTRGMYHKLKVKDAKDNPLKQHHHIYLCASFIQDCCVWLSFLKNATKVQLCWPFQDFSYHQQFQVLTLYSDASQSPDLGFGTVFNNHWFAVQWEKNFTETCQPSIKFLELYALTITLTVWRKHPSLRNNKIQVFCDNKAVVHMVNNLASSCPQCLKLIRILALQVIQFDRKVRVAYVLSRQNVLADSLSHLDFKRFWKNAPKDMLAQPELFPNQLWPTSKIWSKTFNILYFNFS